MATEYDVIQRDLGRLEGTVFAHGKKLEELDAKMDQQTELLHKINGHLAHERGSKKTRNALALGGASVLGWVLSHALDWWKS